MKDIVLNERYGEGTIPSNTKTGDGPILLTSSFTYVRDWINKHQFKNEPNARLICSLVNGTPITTQTISKALYQLKERIKRLVESNNDNDSIDKLKKQRTKKWNPYCIRHSTITDDSDHLPEYAVEKKARWVIGSKQSRRYIKRRMGDELKNKILEHAGIKIESKTRMVSRSCGRCGYMNKLESKYCEGSGCNYPLTQLALDEIKAAERAKLQELVNESNLERNNAIQALQQELKSKTQEIQSLGELCKHSLELSSKQNGTISDYKGMVDDVNSRYFELMGLYENLKSKFDTSVSITKTAFERIDELQSVMRGGLLIKPGRRTAEELQRRAKILLQVAPDWQKRIAPVNARLTPGEERKVMELINQPKVS
jgi:hypothetical protein